MTENYPTDHSSIKDPDRPFKDLSDLEVVQQFWVHSDEVAGLEKLHNHFKKRYCSASEPFGGLGANAQKTADQRIDVHTYLSLYRKIFNFIEYELILNQGVSHILQSELDERGMSSHLRTISFKVEQDSDDEAELEGFMGLEWAEGAPQNQSFWFRGALDAPNAGDFPGSDQPDS